MFAVMTKDDNGELFVITMAPNKETAQYVLWKRKEWWPTQYCWIQEVEVVDQVAK